MNEFQYQWSNQYELNRIERLFCLFVCYSMFLFDDVRSFLDRFEWIFANSMITNQQKTSFFLDQNRWMITLLSSSHTDEYSSIFESNRNSLIGRCGVGEGDGGGVIFNIDGAWFALSNVWTLLQLGWEPISKRSAISKKLSVVCYSSWNSSRSMDTLHFLPITKRFQFSWEKNNNGAWKSFFFSSFRRSIEYSFQCFFDHFDWDYRY